jgi:hypothetical protein
MELQQQFFRSRELMHSEACALWVDKLHKQFPDAKLIRDFEFYNNESVSEILLTSKNDYELLPDILMILQGKPGQEKIFVAFEIERSRKSAARLLAKLRKYADETALDGVVYICESSQVSDPVKKAFKSKIGHKSLRISHYSDYFLLLANKLDAPVESKFQMFNAANDAVFFDAWIDQIKSTPLALRRSKKFSLGAASCSE